MNMIDFEYLLFLFREIETCFINFLVILLLLFNIYTQGLQKIKGEKVFHFHPLFTNKINLFLN
jgi:hypothetical protein